MISRLMISLKKASRDKEGGWTSHALSRTHVKTITQMEFGEHSNSPEDFSGTISEEVALSDFRDRQVGRGGDEGTV